MSANILCRYHCLYAYSLSRNPINLYSASLQHPQINQQITTTTTTIPKHTEWTTTSQQIYTHFGIANCNTHQMTEVFTIISNTSTHTHARARLPAAQIPSHSLDISESVSVSTCEWKSIRTKYWRYWNKRFFELTKNKIKEARREKATNTSEKKGTHTNLCELQSQTEKKNKHYREHPTNREEAREKKRTCTFQFDTQCEQMAKMQANVLL